MLPIYLMIDVYLSLILLRYVYDRFLAQMKIIVFLFFYRLVVIISFRRNTLNNRKYLCQYGRGTGGFPARLNQSAKSAGQAVCSGRSASSDVCGGDVVIFFTGFI